MNREEFLNSTDKLQDLYNKRLNETQIDFWFNELKKYEITKYKRAIGEYVKQNKTFPTIADILSKIKVLNRTEEEESQGNEAISVKCKTCNGSGLVKYYDENKYEFLCRCYCDNGKKYLSLPIRDYKDVFFYRVPEKEEPLLDDYSQINF